MKRNAVICLVLLVEVVGCVLELHEPSDDISIELTQQPLPIPMVDAGFVEAHADVSSEMSDTLQCTGDCDCFDDNVCTDDQCIDGTCKHEPHDGTCGSTIGTCRGTWCCSGEYTCYQAFDNESTCVGQP